MKNNNENKIKYWTVGTSAILYLDNVKRWILNENLISAMTEQNNFAIVLNNCKDKKEDVIAKFSCEENEKTIVYETSKSHTNTYNRTTLTQFLRVLCYFEILILQSNENNKYVLTQEFINKFVSNKKLNDKNVDKEIAIFLLGSVNKKFKEYYVDLAKNFEEKKLVNSEKMNSMFSKEGNDDYKITRSLLYHVNEIEKFVDLDKIKKIYNKESNIEDDNQTSENFSFKKVFSTKILNYFVKEELNKNEEYLFLKKHIRNIICIIRSFYNLPSEFSRMVLDETKNIAEEYRNYLDKEEYKQIHYQREDNMPECKQKTIYHLLTDFKKHGINIPIFQRDYVWNNELINNLIDSLYEDFISNNYSYLNNIIMCSWKGKVGWKIIDGQQRIFTLLLILFSLFKITIYYQFDLDHEILELLFSSNRNEYKDIYTNVQETNIYGNFSKIIENQEEKQESKIVKDIIRNIIDNLTKKLIKIENEREKNNCNISGFINHILWNTYVSSTILPNTTPEKIFENINKNGKALDSLDLLRNYIYSKCINNEWKISKNNNIENHIEKYNKIIGHFFDDKNKINYKRLENFTLVLYKREVKELNNKFSKYNKLVYIFNLLKQIFDVWEKQSDKIDYILDCFLDSIYKYEYIINCKKSKNANYPKVEISALSNQIYGASLGGNTVFVSIIWKLLDEFNAFNWSNENITKNNDLFELSKWLFEIERFNIFWKILAFEGQSISSSLDLIVKDFFDDNGNWKENISGFRNKLLEIIPKLKSLDNQDKNEQLFNMLDTFESNPLALSNQLKFLLLNRINFALNNIGNNEVINNESLYIKANGFSINNEFRNWHNILQYEHCLSKKDELSKNMSEEKLEDFVKHINLFGNGSILDPGKNKEIKNIDLTEKMKKYETISKNNLTIYGKDGFLQGFDKLQLNINNPINKLDVIYEWIETRTKELLGLVKDIYSY